MSEKQIGVVITVCLSIIFMVITGVILLAITFALNWSWNFIVPPLFHGPSMSLPQSFAAWVVLILIGSIFRSHPSRSVRRWQ